MNTTHEKKQPSIVVIGGLIEGMLALLALGISWFGFFDRQQPLSGMDREAWLNGLIWGLAALVPMLIYLAWFHFYPTRLLQPMRDFVDAEMRPLFKGCSLLDLAIISILAGFCEELFFRWCLQGGLTTVLPDGIVCTCIALLSVSLFFGLCHWVNASYGISTFLIGVYLGWIMIASKSWLGPAIAHTLFDFIALVYIARWQAEPSEPGGGVERQEPASSIKR
ncbi:MAG: CPBP family intramembrane glutamic endopeptidase [Planctomycetota bacterium]